MLSRTADSLYWLSRYMERAENLSRIIGVAERLGTLPSAYMAASSEWASAIATAACEDIFYNNYKEATRANVIEFLVASEANPSSILTCVETPVRSARR
jgi:uncharacterized alpha-E superfamily protein